LDGVARVLSVGAGDVQGRVEKLIEDKKAAAKELKGLKKSSAGFCGLPPVRQKRRTNGAPGG